MNDGVLPWGRLFCALVGRGMAPCAFWRLSLPELHALAGPHVATLPRNALDTLMARFPDRKTKPPKEMENG